MIDSLPKIEKAYPTLPAMLRKFDHFARKSCFTGSTPAEFKAWKNDTRKLLHNLLGLDKMEAWPPTARM